MRRGPQATDGDKQVFHEVCCFCVEQSMTLMQPPWSASALRPPQRRVLPCCRTKRCPAPPPLGPPRYVRRCRGLSGVALSGVVEDQILAYPLNFQWGHAGRPPLQLTSEANSFIGRRRSQHGNAIDQTKSTLKNH
jgi:hypothetical protein